MIKRIIVSNFRSLGEDVVVELGPLTALVGVNGSGKSNVADVLQFVADCLNHGLDVAMSRRGGIGTLRRVGAGDNGAIQIRVEMESAEGPGFWEIAIGEGAPDEYRVLSRRHPVQGFVADELKGIAIYKIFPDSLREPQPLDLRKPMREHGENWASILRGLEKDSRGCDLLAALGQIVGDIDDYRTTAVGGFVIPEFRHITEGGMATWVGLISSSRGMARSAPSGIS